MNLYAIYNILHEVTSEAVPRDFPRVDRFENIKKELSPIFIHFCCIFPDRTGKTRGLLDSVNKGGNVENGVPKLLNIIVGVLK